MVWNIYIPLWYHQSLHNPSNCLFSYIQSAMLTILFQPFLLGFTFAFSNFLSVYSTISIANVDILLHFHQKRDNRDKFAFHYAMVQIFHLLQQEINNELMDLIIIPLLLILIYRINTDLMYIFDMFDLVWCYLNCYCYQITSVVCHWVSSLGIN